MGIALLSIADLLSPLQSLANRWMPKGRSRRVSTAGLRYVYAGNLPGQVVGKLDEQIENSFPARISFMTSRKQRRPYESILTGFSISLTVRSLRHTVVS